MHTVQPDGAIGFASTPDEIEAERGGTGERRLVGPVELTIVLPTFNERGNIEPLIARLEATLAGIAWEAIFVDDDSRDGTAEHVRAISRTKPYIRCVQRIGKRDLSGQGFKILIDLFASSPRPLAFKELPYQFRLREHGESKLDTLVAWEYLQLLLDKLIGHIVPVRFALFAMIGGLGLVVHLVT